MTKITKSKLKELIGENKVNEVINSLLKVFESEEKSELLDEVYIQSSKWESYNKDLRRGIKTNEDLQIQISRINTSLLQLIDNLEDKKLYLKAGHFHFNINKIFFLLSFAILLSIVFILIIKNSHNPTSQSLSQLNESFDQSSIDSIIQNSDLDSKKKEYIKLLQLRYEEMIEWMENLKKDAREIDPYPSVKKYRLELERSIILFKRLHKRNIIAISNDDMILSHEITREIHQLFYHIGSLHQSPPDPGIGYAPPSLFWCYEAYPTFEKPTSLEDTIELDMVDGFYYEKMLEEFKTIE